MEVPSHMKSLPLSLLALMSLIPMNYPLNNFKKFMFLIFDYPLYKSYLQIRDEQIPVTV